MSIPASFLDELRQRTTLSGLIQRTGTSLKRAGREWKACCPFHNENTPSFTVNDEKAFYHCFGCGAHGDAIGWLVDQQGMSFIDAVKMLAEMAGMEVPAQDPQAARRAKEKDGLVDLNAKAASFFHVRLHEDEGSLEASEATLYLSQRGIGPLTMEKFGIGFAPGSRRGQPSALCAALPGADEKDLERLGLVKRNPDSGRVYDFFRRRIIIPIHDARGRVIAFGGRIVGAGEPKYLNSPETPTFDKGRTLFNLHRAAAPARAKNKMLIVEGYMDVIGVDSVGFDAAVAPNGTALTESQLFLAWRLVDAPVVAFDGDRAGQKAAAKAAYRALAVMQPGKTLRFAVLPDGQDPDDLARSGGLEAINRLHDNAISLVDVIWRDLNSRYQISDPDGRAGMSAAIRDILGTIKDQDVRSAYHRALSDRFNGQNKPRASTQQAGNGGLANAIELSLIIAILDTPTIVENESTALKEAKWRVDEHRRITEALDQAAWQAIDEDRNVTAEDIALVIEAAGLTEYVTAARRNYLRMPHNDRRLSEEDRIEKIRAALTANFE